MVAAAKGLTGASDGPQTDGLQTKGRRVELARRIKEHRERLGMSQTELAQAIFVTRQTISNWETDRTYPDVQSLLLLSNLFGVSVDALVREDTQELRSALAEQARKLNRFGVVMVVFGIACLAWVIAGVVLDLDLAVIAVPAVALIAPAAVAAFFADKLRHDNQLYAYQAVDALLAGEDPDVQNRYNQRVGKHWVARRVVQTIVGVILGLCCGWGAASILARLVSQLLGS